MDTIVVTDDIYIRTAAYCGEFDTIIFLTIDKVVIVHFNNGTIKEGTVEINAIIALANDAEVIVDLNC